MSLHTFGNVLLAIMANYVGKLWAEMTTEYQNSELYQECEIQSKSS